MARSILDMGAESDERLGAIDDLVDRTHNPKGYEFIKNLREQRASGEVQDYLDPDNNPEAFIRTDDGDYINIHEL